MSYSIRLASLADVPQIRSVIPLSVRVLQAAYYSSEQMEGALGSVFAVDTQLIHDRTYYVAEDAGMLVGCGGWSRRKTLFGGDGLKSGMDDELKPGEDSARIRAFFIRPGWERRGIGSEIMSRCESTALAAGFSRIEIVATLVGEHLYAKFGYTVTKRYDIALENGHGLPVVQMTKSVVGPSLVPEPMALPVRRLVDAKSAQAKT